MRPRPMLLVFSMMLAIAVLGFGKDEAKLATELPAVTVSILNKAALFELHSLDPDSKLGNGEKGFHGFKVLGTASITDTEVRTRILTALQEGIAKSDGERTFCFAPRHGVRAKQGDRMVDLLICFECHRINAYMNGKRELTTTGDPQATIDEVLKKAGVPLPKPALAR